MQNNIIKVMENGLDIPNQVTIPFIEGDGIGKDITQKALKVIDKALEQVYQGKKKILWKKEK